MANRPTDSPQFRFSRLQDQDSDPEIDVHAYAYSHPNNGKLYARQTEEGMLVEAYRRRCCTSSTTTSHQSELVLLTGPSGTGKSRLAQALQGRVEQDGGFWASGKFDQLERPETSYPLMRAMTDLVERLLQRRNNQDDDHKLDLKAVTEVANTEHLLVDWIPVLRQFKTKAATCHHADCCQPQHAHTDAPKRLAVALCRLIKAICSPEVPLILFVDDIQWAKPAPLDLIRALVTDTELKNGFMVLAACRGNEVPMEHHLSVTLRELEATGVQLTDIQLGNLKLDGVQNMVRDYFQLSSLKDDSAQMIEIQPLAQHIFDQTKGNIFFTIQMIRKVQQDHQQHQQTRRRGGSSKGSHNNLLIHHPYATAVELITEQILRLPKDVQEVLKLASCFGAEFHSSLLEDLLDFDIRDALQIAETQQLIIRRCVGSETYHFLHDQIQQSSYTLIPDAEREATHLEIGRRLWNELNEQELQQFGFAVVRQIRLGSGLIQDEKERYMVADLMLKAGIHATNTSAFDEAASHFDMGISLLAPSRHWEDEYFLSLDLYRRAGEVAYCIGNHERVAFLTDQTIANARTNRDKLGAYISQIESLTATNQPKQALTLALEVLQNSGYNLPRKSSIATILYQLYKTKRQLKRFSSQQIRRMRIVHDKETLDAMKVFNLAICNAVYADPMYFPIISMIGVQTALSVGLCGAAAVPYASMSMLLCNVFGDADLGFQLARLSLAIIEDRKAYEWQPRVLCMVHSFVFVLQESPAAQMEPLLLAHRQAKANGDIETSMIAGHLYTSFSFYAAVPLKPLLGDMKMYLKIMEAHGQTIAMQYLLPPLQGVQILLEGSDQPGLLTGDYMNEEEFGRVQSSDNAAALAYMKITKLFVACVMGEYQIGEDLAKDSTNWPMESFSVLVNAGIYLYGAICQAALAGKQTRQRLRRVKQNLCSLKRLVRLSKGRYDPHIQIIKAEIAGMRGRTEASLSKFQRAIDRARLEGLHHIEGLANERAAAVLRQAGRDEQANTYLVLATQAYQKWGADSKVSQLVKSLPNRDKKQFEGSGQRVVRMEQAPGGDECTP